MTASSQPGSGLIGNPIQWQRIGGGAELSGRIDAFFVKNSNPKYNLWDGGMAMVYYHPPVQAAIWRDAFGEVWKPEYPQEN
jgi:hypothetical protein